MVQLYKNKYNIYYKLYRALCLCFFFQFLSRYFACCLQVFMSSLLLLIQFLFSSKIVRGYVIHSLHVSFLFLVIWISLIILQRISYSWLFSFNFWISLDSPVEFLSLRWFFWSGSTLNVVLALLFYFWFRFMLVQYILCCRC